VVSISSPELPTHHKTIVWRLADVGLALTAFIVLALLIASW
jgi:hypothetical protein